MSSFGIDEPPLVEGYLIGSRLGSGASASVWRATPLDGGPVVAVKVLGAGPDADRELAVLRAVAHPHVVRLHRAIVLPPDRLALVLDLVDGGTLASVVGERGQLSPGEVVTVVAPLAQALADLHAEGVQHGDLAPGNVLFDRSGRPVLTDLGTPRITGEPRAEVFGTAGYVDPVVLAGGVPGPPSDVYGLGALAWYALAGAPPESAPLRVRLGVLAPTAPRALVAAIESAVDADPSARPAPGQLAAALLAACPAEAVWASGRGPDVGGLTHRIRALAREPEPEAPASHRRRPPRPSSALLRRVSAAVAAAAAVAGLLLVLPRALGGDDPAARASAVGAGAGATSSAGQPPQPAAAPTAAAERPAATPVAVVAPDLRQVRAVLTRLSAGRASSFEHPEQPTRDLWVRGSPAAAQDALALRTLAAQGVAYRRLQLGFDRVRLVQAAADRVVVDAVSSASAYEVVDRAGTTVQQVAGGEGVPVRLELVRTAAGWRLHGLRAT